jgi:ribonuclease III
LDYKEPAGIDLHIHSTASDGTLSPSEILEMARQLKLSAVSITDHDTISGAKEALLTGIPSSIQFVTGVEISAAPIVPFDAGGSYHILGYFFRIDDAALNQVLAKLQSTRHDRNLKILQHLNLLGIELTIEDVKRETSKGQAGRPHIALALMRKGIVSSVNEAFDTYLGSGKPAYADKFRISSRRAIELIINAGGIPVLAHPGLLKIGGPDIFNAFFAALKALGLRGIEVYYPEHTNDQIAMFLALAASHGLLITGGSDFHGALTPGVKMGSGGGDLFVPFSLYETLKEAADFGSSLLKLEQTLGYAFQNRSLLEEALRHSSFVNEQLRPDQRDNERLEFLGDAVLNLAVGHLLMQKNPALSEGDLTKIRADMVNEQQLAAIAAGMHLGKHLLLGKGELQSGGSEKSSILADALEAVIAAVYLDGGYAASFQVIESHFSHLLEALSSKTARLDFKSRLQELVQFLQKPSPQYRIVAETGPDHDKTFIVQLDVCDIQTHGRGKSKKTAEQDAACTALKILKPDEYGRQ